MGSAHQQLLATPSLTPIPTKLPVSVLFPDAGLVDVMNYDDIAVRNAASRDLVGVHWLCWHFVAFLLCFARNESKKKNDKEKYCKIGMSDEVWK